MMDPRTDFTNLTTNGKDTTYTTRLFDVHKEVSTVTANKNNPHFKNNYADLERVTLYVKSVLLKHGLFLSQPIDHNMVLTEIIDGETGEVVASSRFPIVAKDMSDPQKFGGGVTYARRYSILSLLAIPVDDDDGNTAANGTTAAVTRNGAPVVRSTAFMENKMPPALCGRYPDFIGKTWREAADHNPIEFKTMVTGLMAYTEKKNDKYKEKNMAEYREALDYVKDRT